MFGSLYSGSDFKFDIGYTRDESPGRVEWAAKFLALEYVKMLGDLQLRVLSFLNGLE